MATEQAATWCIRAGESGQADALFLQRQYVAVGWNTMGDMSAIPNDQEAFKARVRSCYPDEKPGAIPNFAGQLRRFAYDVNPEDLVVYPSKLDRHIHIGRVAGPYVYDPKIDEHYPHLRRVRWLRSEPRTHFTQGALYEIGGLMTLFQIKNYAAEFQAAAAGTSAKLPAPIERDATIPQVAENIEDTTRDYVLKRLARDLKGHPLAYFVAHVLGTMGYRTRVSPEGSDGGVDIIAHTDELGFQPPLIKVQVKSGEGSIGAPIVNALYGNVGHNEFGLFVTLGSFTAQAQAFAKSKSNLRLVDGEVLVDLILEHYERFDSRYKGMLPLKRVYVPDPQDVGEG